MKKILTLFIVSIIILTGCSEEQQPEGITITREKYDEFLAAEALNDRLKEEISYLETRLDDYKSKESSANSNTANNTSSNTVNNTANNTSSTNNEISSQNTSQVGNATTNNNSVSENYTADAYKSVKVSPVNEVIDGTDFSVFIAEFKKALSDKNEAYIKEHISENAKISSMGHTGFDGLARYWSMDKGNKDFYVVMNATLRFGIVDTSNGNGTEYTAPYTYANFPDGYNKSEYVICTGNKVNVRRGPSTDEESFDQLTYDVVKVSGEEKDGWQKLILPNGDRGYMSAQFLKSPLDYRVRFVKEDGKWVFDYFLKGEE